MKKHLNKPFLLFIAISLFFITLPTDVFSGDREFKNFIARLDGNTDIKVWYEMADEQLKEYQKTGDKFHLYNEYLTRSHIAKREGNMTEGIRLLIWIIEDAEEQNTNQMAWVKYHLASTLAFVGANKASQDYVLPVINNPSPVFDKSVLHLSTNLVATNYFQTENYDKALIFFKKSFDKYEKDNFKMKASMLNNIGLCYKNKKQYEESLEYFLNARETIESSIQQTDEMLFLKYLIEGNIGSSYQLLNDLEKAEQYLSNEFVFYVKNPQYFENAEATFCSLLEIYQKTGNESKAEDLLENGKQLEKLLEENSEKKAHEPRLFKCIFDYYRMTGDTENALIYSDKLVRLQIHYQDKITEQTNELNEVLYTNQLSNLRFKVKTEKYKADVALNEKRQSNRIFISVIALMLILSFIGYYFIIQRRKTALKDKIIFEQRALIELKKNELLQSELQIHQEKITGLTQNLNLKKETEKAFLSKINEIKRNKSKDPEEAIKELQLSVNSLLGIDKRMEDLKISKDSNTENFRKELKKKHPVLSKPEIDLCVLYKMKLSSKEIGAIKNMSPGTIRVYKSKIKAKLSLEDQQSLGNYLNQIVNH